MAFTFAAFSYIIALIVDAFLIFFAIFHVSFRTKTMWTLLLFFIIFFPIPYGTNLFFF